MSSEDSSRGRAYADPKFVDRYLEFRHSPVSANEIIERPIIDELVGSVAGKRVLDLGCGDGTYGAELLARGCESYVGVDGSARMIEVARAKSIGSKCEFVHSDMAQWRYPRSGFDLIVSRLAIHYVENLVALFERASQALVEGGRIVVSVEHPVLTSSQESMGKGKGKRQSWIVNRYFETGVRFVDWWGVERKIFHRTIEDHFSALQTAGLVVESLRESRPRRELFADEREFVRRSRVPIMLFLAARRCGPYPIESDRKVS